MNNQIEVIKNENNNTNDNQIIFILKIFALIQFNL
jgi:hypothetical protein